MLNDEQLATLPPDMQFALTTRFVTETTMLYRCLELAATALLALKEAQAQIKRVEWIDDDGGNAYCPECEQWKWDGHTADCKLAKVVYSLDRVDENLSKAK